MDSPTQDTRFSPSEHQALDIPINSLASNESADRLFLAWLAKRSLPQLQVIKLVIDLEAISNRVERAYGLKTGDILSKTRVQHIASARQVTAYLCREMTALSYPAIGEYLGQDHSTIIHSYNSVAARIQQQPQFRAFVERLQRQIEDMASTT